jgi:hypothetical protein
MHVKQWAAWSLLALPAWHFLRGSEWVGLSLIAFSLHSVAYLLVPRYRLWAEVQAYKEQALYYPDDRRESFAEYLATAYNLKITSAQALKELS